MLGGQSPAVDIVDREVLQPRVGDVDQHDGQAVAPEPFHLVVRQWQGR